MAGSSAMTTTIFSARHRHLPATRRFDDLRLPATALLLELDPTIGSGKSWCSVQPWHKGEGLHAQRFQRMGVVRGLTGRCFDVNRPANDS
jgi:hypothetical protein